MNDIKIDGRCKNGGHSTAGRAGRKKRITDEKLRRKPCTFSLNEYEYLVTKSFVETIKSNPKLLKANLSTLEAMQEHRQH